MPLADNEGMQLERRPVKYRDERVKGLYRRGKVFEYRGLFARKVRVRNDFAGGIGFGDRAVEQRILFRRKLPHH